MGIMKYFAPTDLGHLKESGIYKYYAATRRSEELDQFKFFDHFD
jgi:hypothetical protein